MSDVDPSFDQKMATGKNGAVAPVHNLQELTLAPLPTPVLATVSATGCSGEWGPVRPRISTVCSTLHPVVASVGFRERVSQVMADLRLTRPRIADVAANVRIRTGRRTAGDGGFNRSTQHVR